MKPIDDTYFCVFYTSLYLLHCLVFASSNVSLNFCIPILLGMIIGLMFSSSRGLSVSSLALSFRAVFLVWFVVFFVFVLLVPFVSLVGTESFLMMMMMMTHLVAH